MINTGSPFTNTFPSQHPTILASPSSPRPFDELEPRVLETESDLENSHRSEGESMGSNGETSVLTEDSSFPLHMDPQLDDRSTSTANDISGREEKGESAIETEPIEKDDSDTKVDTILVKGASQNESTELLQPHRAANIPDNEQLTRDFLIPSQDGVSDEGSNTSVSHPCDAADNKVPVIITSIPNDPVEGEPGADESCTNSESLGEPASITSNSRSMAETRALHSPTACDNTASNSNDNTVVKVKVAKEHAQMTATSLSKQKKFQAATDSRITYDIFCERRNRRLQALKNLRSSLDRVVASSPIASQGLVSAKSPESSSHNSRAFFQKKDSELTMSASPPARKMDINKSINISSIHMPSTLIGKDSSCENRDALLAAYKLIEQQFLQIQELKSGEEVQKETDLKETRRRLAQVQVNRAWEAWQLREKLAQSQSNYSEEVGKLQQDVAGLKDTLQVAKRAHAIDVSSLKVELQQQACQLSAARSEILILKSLNPLASDASISKATNEELNDILREPLLRLDLGDEKRDSVPAGEPEAFPVRSAAKVMSAHAARANERRMEAATIHTDEVRDQPKRRRSRQRALRKRFTWSKFLPTNNA